MFLPFHVAGPTSSVKTDRALADDGKLERMGFTKYVKSDEGKYEKVVGKGPDLLNR